MSYLKSDRYCTRGTMFNRELLSTASGLWAMDSPENKKQMHVQDPILKLIEVHRSFAIQINLQRDTQQMQRLNILLFKSKKKTTV